MKKVFIGLGLMLFSYQAGAVLVAGVDFVDTANNLDSAVGAYTNNTTGTGAAPIVDGNGASYVMSADTPAILDVSFKDSLGSPTLYDTSAVDITLLLIGNSYVHSGTVSLFGGTSTFSTSFFIDSTSDNLVGYTGYNSVTASPEAGGSPTTLGIYALTISLADGGTFSGVQLDIGGYSAVPSMVGVTTVVPVPAAVWLFGSGLIGLVGVARRKK